jgi:beta-lactamase class D
MNRRYLLLSALSPLLLSSALGRTPEPRPAWARFFQDADAQGTIVVLDERGATPWAAVHARERAGQRLSPASTFKIPHSLFALDAGVVRDEFQTFHWDGKHRSVPAWNADQDLRSAFRNSAVWVYEGFAREMGLAREQAYLHKIRYGNQSVAGPMPFWVDGELAISAEEQIALLRALQRNELPFSIAHQRLVKDIMVVEAGRDWILRAKSGWSGSVGWWIGWIEWPAGAVFFALNIDTPGRLADLPKRIEITRRVLNSIDALPALDAASIARPLR